MPTAASVTRLGADTTATATATMSRRRTPLRIIAGLLLIALGFVTGAVLLSTVNRAVEVLSVAQAVPAGSVLTDMDLTSVNIVAAETLHVIPATRRAGIIGQTAAVPLAAGSLLTAEQLGPTTDPGAGQSILAVALKPGRAPAGLAPGAAVVALVAHDETPSGTGTLQAPAVVRHVEPPDASGLTVVTVQMASDAALRIASVSGDLAIVVRGR